MSATMSLTWYTSTCIDAHIAILHVHSLHNVRASVYPRILMPYTCIHTSLRTSTLVYMYSVYFPYILTLITPYIHIPIPPFPGTFAVICLMVGNSINQVFSGKGLDFCREEANAQMLINGTNTTCGDMEVDVAVSLALTSGIIMVGVVREGCWVAM